MRELEALAAQARMLADGSAGLADLLTPAESEVARQMQICNACRYCEGFCAVFPAMTRRLEFGKADVHFMANLCHNCGACLHACQYAPPHEFAVNVPRAMAVVRASTYADYAWPRGLGVLYQRSGLTLGLALAAGLSLFMGLARELLGAPGGTSTLNSFYQVFPHNLLAAIFIPVFLYVVLALSLGVRRFWRDITPATSGAPLNQDSLAEAGANALTLKYLDGGHGEGCNNADDAWTLARRRAHHLTFYGFLLCFAATGLATVYHYGLGWTAPYDLPSLPKILGVAGGMGMIVGTVALGWLHLTRHPEHGDAGQRTMDRGFITLLFLTSVSGMALWLGRSGAFMPHLLVIHLGVVMALFLTLPYGKFAHGVYRTAALMRFAVEKRQPNRLGVGSD